ncbi:MAG: PAS domain S-box protein [Cyanobacteria bacterium SZAS-4]|nr:PAS domain S-box protein [Cyanobacteria bacterium SZAS-4]
MPLKFTLARQAYLLICIPLVFQICFVLALIVLVKDANEQAAVQAKLKEKIGVLEDLYSLPVQMRTAAKAYMLSSSQSDMTEFENARQQMRGDLDKLLKMTANIPAQQAIIKKLDRDIVEGLRRADEFMALIQEDKTNVAERFNELMQVMIPVEIENVKTIRSFVAELKSEDNKRPDIQKSLSDQVVILILIGVSAVVILDIALAVWFSNGTAKRLSILMDNTAKLALGKELNPPTKGSDEITDLDEVFHSMAAVLRDAEQKERAMVENAVDVICSLDSDGKFLRVSPAAATVWHVDAEELVGQRVIKLFPPEQREQFVQTLKSLVDRREKSEFESLMLLPDGSTRHILWSVQWSRAEKALFCVAHDITERKRNEEALRESEARTRLVIETMPVGVMLLDRRGQINQVNPMMRKLFLRHRSDELIGSQLTDLCATQNTVNQPSTQQLSELFDKAMGRFQEVTAKRANGTEFPAEVLLTPFGGPNSGKLLGMIMDVTERHEIERFKNEFLGVVSHELRNPLTAIRGSLKMMMVGALGQQTEQAQKAITIAERSATRLIGLVNDLLDAEKLEAGKLDMQFELRPLYPILEMGVESVKAFADDHQVTVQYKQTESLVYADDHRIVQVLINLLSNAIKYSPKGSTVRVDVVSIGDLDEVRITDQGRGIPASHVNSLFQRFKQVERSDATAKGGTGLGLVICKAIIEQHMGTIGVESEIGKGSTFWFRLPNKIASAQSTPAHALSAPRDRAGQPEII